MTIPDHAFANHPELRGRIKDPSESFFRDLDLAQLDALMDEAGHPPDWRYPDAVREDLREKALAGRRDRDLWVFAYGSLLWDPAFYFEEVRRAHLAGYSRSFCLWDEGARGTMAEPGLMAALDIGDGCTGLAYRIASAVIEEETERLFRRELIADAYQAVFVQIETDNGPEDALTFAANHASEYIRPGIPIAEQARMLSCAAGLLGPGYDYIANLASHLDELEVEDTYIADLWARVQALTSATAPQAAS